VTCTTVTVLHHSADVIERLVRSLPADVELVAVENAVTDDAPTIVRSVRPDALMIRTERNLGFGGGCNLAAAAASGDTLVFLNPDCEVIGDALARLEQHLSRHPLDVVSPALLDDEGRLIAAIRTRSSPLHEVIELLPLVRRWLIPLMPRDVASSDSVYRIGGPVEVLQGACLAIRRDHFASLGGFDEDFFLYSEEESLCERVRCAGGRAWYLPDAVVHHTWGTSTAKRPGFSTEHFYRSRAVLYRKRYGSTVAGAAAVGIGIAAVLDATAALLIARTGRGEHRRTALAAILRGLRKGATDRLASPTFWPPSAERRS
jgi:N-acetylglucosaminyl-diphospho-decaprenol L-rhamnosyltransferase